MVKHFLKTTLLFSGMILLGLLSVYLINYFENNKTTTSTENTAGNLE
ncbi:MAG TPA: hypothetical protein PKZ36_03255 [Candidatus Paceibacterota bacterium]|nr:hypothetical protein [Candidatus Paceibacterota bacterium]